MEQRHIAVDIDDDMFFPCNTNLTKTWIIDQLSQTRYCA